MPDAAVTTMVRPEGAAIDFDALRADRRRRLLDAMAGARLDALVLGRPANGFFASGANQLWTAGARPFGPACVVVASTGRVHLLSTWDEGVPAEIAHEDLFGLSWNPANIVTAVGRIPGLGGARRIGTDSSSPGFGGLLAVVAPDAEHVDATDALWAARLRKSPAEIRCVTTATTLAEGALAVMAAAVAPGVTERELVGLYLETIAAHGSPAPPSEGVACVTPRTGPVRLRRVPSTRGCAPGELVVLDPGARFAGYEGGVGRTCVVAAEPTAAQQSLARRAEAGLDALTAACRIGATGTELRAAWAATGERLPDVPIVYGVGIGMEPPVVTGTVGGAEVLHADTVLALTSWVAEEGVGGVLLRDLIVLRDSGAELISRYRRRIA